MAKEFNEKPYAGRLIANNTSETGYSIVRASQVGGHRAVRTKEDLYTLTTPILSEVGDNAAPYSVTENGVEVDKYWQDAIGQVWYVEDEDNYYRLVDWSNKGNEVGWKISTSPFTPGTGDDSAVGNVDIGCEASGQGSFATGIYAKAKGQGSIALGRYCEASGRSSVSLGGLLTNIKLTGEANSLTYKVNSKVEFYTKNPEVLIGLSIISSVTDGTNTELATITGSVLLETGELQITTDKTLSSTSINSATYYISAAKAIGNTAVSIGSAWKASGDYSVVMGRSAALGKYSTAIGQGNLAKGESSVAMGASSLAEGNYSAVFGLYNNSTGHTSFTTGQNNTASGTSSTAIGGYSVAEGNTSTAIGAYCSASNTMAVAIGQRNTASGKTSFSTGFFTTASGDYSYSEGGSLWNVYLSGDGTDNSYQITKGSNWQFVEDLEKLPGSKLYNDTTQELSAIIDSYTLGEDGYTITVVLDRSIGTLEPDSRFVIPLGKAEGECSHSQNGGTKAVGNYSTSSGAMTIAEGTASSAFGDRTISRGNSSATFGEHTFTTNTGEFALGISNISHTGETEDSQTLLSVGIGESSELDMATRIENQTPFTSMQDGKNALEIMRNGDIWFGEYNNGIKAYDNATKTTPFIEKSSEETLDDLLLSDGKTTKLKTINGNSLIGDGNIVISSGSGSGDSSYILPAAGIELGGVKSGGDVTISEGVISISEATTETKGLMSAADKVKLDEFKYSSDYAFTLSKDIHVKNLAPTISLCAGENSDNIIELHVEGEDYSGIYINSDGGFTNSTISNEACIIRQVDYTSKTVKASVGYDPDLSDEALTVGCISGTAHINLFGFILDDEGGSSNGYCGLHASGSENTTLSIDIDNGGADLGLYNHLTNEEVLIVACEPDSYHSDKGTTYILSPKFIKTGGTADEILMADGSVQEISNLLTDTKVISLNNESEDNGGAVANITLNVEDTFTPNLCVSMNCPSYSTESVKMYLGYDDNISDEELSIGIVANGKASNGVDDECRAAGILADMFTGFKAYTGSREAIIRVGDNDCDSYILLQSNKEEDLVMEQFPDLRHWEDPKGIYIRCRIPEGKGLAEKYGESHIKCPRFITTGGTSDQVVLGDGTLKPLSEIGGGGGNGDVADELPQEYVNALNILKYTTDGDITEGITITSTSDKTRYIATKSADGNSTLEIGPNYLYGWGSNDDESVEIYTSEGWIKASNYIEANKFVIPDGTATQILMADGSVKEISEIGGGNGEDSRYTQFIEAVNKLNEVTIPTENTFTGTYAWDEEAGYMYFSSPDNKGLMYSSNSGWHEGTTALFLPDIPAATTTSGGVMSPEDKAKLDKIDADSLDTSNFVQKTGDSTISGKININNEFTCSPDNSSTFKISNSGITFIENNTESTLSWSNLKSLKDLAEKIASGYEVILVKNEE